VRCNGTPWACVVSSTNLRARRARSSSSPSTDRIRRNTTSPSLAQILARRPPHVRTILVLERQRPVPQPVFKPSRLVPGGLRQVACDALSRL
jgi:hypothetical protein